MEPRFCPPEGRGGPKTDRAAIKRGHSETNPSKSPDFRTGSNYFKSALGSRVWVRQDGMTAAAGRNAAFITLENPPIITAMQAQAKAKQTSPSHIPDF